MELEDWVFPYTSASSARSRCYRLGIGILDWLDGVLTHHTPRIVCVPPGVHLSWSPRRRRWIQFSRRDELIARQSIYGLSDKEARWEDQA